MAFDYAYGKTILGELELHGVHNEDSGKFQLTSVTIEGQLVIPSRGFVKSLCKRFSISRHVQSDRTSGELLNLIVRSFSLAEVEYRIEWDESGTTWLFARETQPEVVETLEQPAPSDIPSPTSRLEAYGFKPTAEQSTTPQEFEASANAHDWPLFRDTDCQVPAFPLAPEGKQTVPTGDLFSQGPVGTPRPSVN